MTETPPFDVIAAEIVAMVSDSSATAASDTAKTAAVARHLRQVWNARGAADIARLEIEIPHVWTAAEPAGALTRSLRTLDR